MNTKIGRLGQIVEETGQGIRVAGIRRLHGQVEETFLPRWIGYGMNGNLGLKTKML